MITPGLNWPLGLFAVVAGGVLLLGVVVLRKRRFKPNALVLGVWSAWMLWVVFSPLWFRLNTELDGVVVSAQDIPPTRGPRYATKYTLRRPDGRMSDYVAGATSDSLPRSMPIGTYLRKPKWTLYYERDGQRLESGFPWFAALFGCTAFFFLGWSITAKVRETKDLGNTN